MRKLTCLILMGACGSGARGGDDDDQPWTPDASIGECEPASAGARPKRRPVSKDTPVVKSRTHRSTPMPSARGTVPGLSDRKRSIPQ